MLNAIVKEKTLESEVGSLSQSSGTVTGQGGGGAYLAGPSQDGALAKDGSESAHAEDAWLALYLCLGCPTETGTTAKGST